MNNFYKIVTFTIADNLDQVKSALFEAGAGELGSYDSCCFVSKGIGQYRPLKGSIPTVGKLIACAGSYNAICSWIIGVVKNEKTITKKSAETTMAIRSIASPSRFIEGLLLRTTSPRSCTRC